MNDARASWQPLATVATAQRRAHLLQQARRYFARRDVLEVVSPVLSRSAVSDPNIESIAARLQLDPQADHYLHTSPEFCMKRLLCAGYPDIYEICRVFRDGESGRLHQPEFTMIEWYRHDFGLDEIIADAVGLLRTLIDPGKIPGTTCRLSYQEAFVRFAGIDPLNADLDSLIENTDHDESLRAALGDRRDDWLDLLLTQKVAPAFARDGLTVLEHYPASQAALARLAPDTPDVAERFEVFVGRLELANGYVELTDAGEQRRRCIRDQGERQASGKPVRPLDENFLSALESGLPPCAGVAVGFDRLLMFVCETEDIRLVQSFAYQGDG